MALGEARGVCLGGARPRQRDRGHAAKAKGQGTRDHGPRLVLSIALFD
jgi:hypothetical protein